MAHARICTENHESSANQLTKCPSEVCGFGSTDTNDRKSPIGLPEKCKRGKGSFQVSRLTSHAFKNVKAVAMQRLPKDMPIENAADATAAGVFSISEAHGPVASGAAWGQ